MFGVLKTDKEKYMRLLDQIIADIPASIATCDDKQLASDKLEKELIERKRVEAPELNLKEKTVEIKKEAFTHYNAPKDMKLLADNDQQMEVVIYTVPVLGDLFFFKELFPHINEHKGPGLSFQRSNLIYREYSLTKVEGDDELLEIIKNNAKREIGSIEGGLAQFAEVIKDFNERRLPEAVRQAIAEEKNRRQELKDSESKLNF